MALTKQQKRNYNKDSYHCPYCGSENISGDPFDYDALGQKVTCNDCDKEWWDTYKFMGIEEITDEKDLSKTVCG